MTPATSGPVLIPIRMFREVPYSKLNRPMSRSIGDAYMAAGGVPDPRPDHAGAVADLALAAGIMPGMLRIALFRSKALAPPQPPPSARLFGYITPKDGAFGRRPMMAAPGFTSPRKI